MIKIGHRGAPGYEPENTLKSFAKAVELGAGMVEFDIQLTKDKQLVVMHDTTVDRTTNGSGRVSRLTLARLKELDAGQGEKIPTLKEAVDFLRGKCQIYIEVKSRKVIDYLIAELKEMNLDSEKVYVAANFFNSLRRVDQLLPHVKVVWTFRATDDLLTEFIWMITMMVFYPFVKHYVQLKMRMKSVDVIGIHHLLCTKNFIDKIHRCNKIVFTWTVDRPRKIKTLKAWGADGIFSNYPDRLN